MNSQTNIINILEQKFNKVLLTRQELAEILTVSIGTVTNLIKDKKIPYVKFGNTKTSSIRFNIVDVAKWIATSAEEVEK
jgi:excisionase family DNA binding protein